MRANSISEKKLKIFRGLESYDKPGFAVVTVGTFDGLHAGHQKIIHSLNQLAAENGGKSVVITFEPHPRMVVGSGPEGLKLIINTERKYEILESLGIDQLVIIPFDLNFSALSYEKFVEEILIDRIGTRILVIGYDHHFGRNREGDYDRLLELSERLNFRIVRIAAQIIDDMAVSSTKIRNALNDGNIYKANRMLGYLYSVTGIVEKGNMLGRSIGFPTANIKVEDHYNIIAKLGVYACRVGIGGKTYAGMGNIGFRPTIEGKNPVIETHIFDFEEDIYGMEITIYFISRIRDEKKFNNLDELKQQLIKDKEDALLILKNNPES